MKSYGGLLSIVFTVVSLIASPSYSEETCRTLFIPRVTQISSIVADLAASRHFILFKYGGNSPSRRIAIDSLSLVLGKSYVVLVTRDRVYIGDRYVNWEGKTAKTHAYLHADIQDYVSENDLAINLDLESDRYSGGAIRLNLDGSVDVSGYHGEKESMEIAEVIAERIGQASPHTTIHWTAGRLTRLQN